MKTLFQILWLCSAICLWRGTTAELNEWIIRDSNSRVCMKMEMDAVILHPIYDIASAVPADAQIVGDFTTCPEETAVFELTWVDKGFDWDIALHFDIVAQSYKLSRFSGTVVYEDGTIPRSWSYVEFSYPKAPWSRSMTCDLFITARARFMNLRWQPYAQLAGGDYGQGKECDHGKWTPVAIFFCIFVILFAIISSIFLYSIINAGG